MRKKPTKLTFDIKCETLYNAFPRVRYVDIHTEEPLTQLLLLEVEHILSHIKFSKKAKIDNTVKLIVYLHCLGYTDKQITAGFHKLLKFYTVENVKKKRQRALKKIDEHFGKEIGFITLMYETFKNCDFMD